MVSDTLVGSLPEGWAYTNLGTACAQGGGGIQTGPFGSQLHAADYVADGIPSIMPQNIGENRVIESEIARITSQDADRLSRYLVRKGDIVYSRRGDVERRALIRDEEDGWLCGTGCLRVRFGNGMVDPTYASYYLGHPAVREWIVRHAHGATMPNLNTSILSSLPFVVPPLPEQRAIAAVLGALDDKIELNRRMNGTLEGLARALFQAWFVEFEPVRAKMAGRPTGLAAEIEALFPDGMEVGEDGGERPRGWGVESLDEIATYLNGLALQKYPPDGADSLPVIKIAQLRKGNTDGADRASMDIPPDYIIDDGDVLFSWSGSLEVVIWCGGQGALNQHLFKVTSNHYPKWYYYLWTKEHLSDFQEIAAGKATTMGHIQRKHLTQAKALAPSRELLEAMDKLMSPLIERIISCNVESRTLAALRDGLLPGLMRGEVRVKGAERLL